MLMACKQPQPDKLAEAISSVGPQNVRPSLVEECFKLACSMNRPHVLAYLQETMPPVDRVVVAECLEQMCMSYYPPRDAIRYLVVSKAHRYNLLRVVCKYAIERSDADVLDMLLSEKDIFGRIKPSMVLAWAGDRFGRNNAIQSVIIRHFRNNLRASTPTLQELFKKACSEGHDDLLVELLQLQTEAGDFMFHPGPKQLQEVCYKGHYKCALVLLALSGDSAIDVSADNWLALRLAVLHRRAMVVKALMTIGRHPIDDGPVSDQSYSVYMERRRANAAAARALAEADRTTAAVAGGARLSAGTTAAVAGGARLSAGTTGTVAGGARLSAGTTGTVAGGARLPAGTTGTVAGGARLSAGTTAAVAGGARLPAVTTATIARRPIRKRRPVPRGKLSTSANSKHSYRSSSSSGMSTATERCGVGMQASGISKQLVTQPQPVDSRRPVPSKVYPVSVQSVMLRTRSAEIGSKLPVLASSRTSTGVRRKINRANRLKQTKQTKQTKQAKQATSDPAEQMPSTSYQKHSVMPHQAVFKGTDGRSQRTRIGSSRRDVAGKSTSTTYQQHKDLTADKVQYQSNKGKLPYTPTPGPRRKETGGTGLRGARRRLPIVNTEGSQVRVSAERKMELPEIPLDDDEERIHKEGLAIESMVSAAIQKAPHLSQGPLRCIPPYCVYAAVDKASSMQLPPYHYWLNRVENYTRRQKAILRHRMVWDPWKRVQEHEAMLAECCPTDDTLKLSKRLRLSHRPCHTNYIGVVMDVARSFGCKNCMDVLHRQWRGAVPVSRRPSRRHLIAWRQAMCAHRDASLLGRCCAEGRPLELGKRLRLGKLACSAGRLVELDAMAREGGHDDCMEVLHACLDPGSTAAMDT